MATVCVGSLNELSVCRVETDSRIQDVDDPKYVEFRIPSEVAILQPGSPRWANYIKGVVAGFHGMGSKYRLLCLECYVVRCSNYFLMFTFLEDM